MNITCPKCNFSKTVEPTKVPDRPVKVNCPKCGQAFTFDKSAHSAISSVEDLATFEQKISSKEEKADPPTTERTYERRIICNACGTVQAPADQCIHCSATINPASQHQLKAGFWIRVVAYMIDFLLLLVVQSVLSLLIGIIIGMMGIATEDDPAINVVIWLFGTVLSISYAVFFTGYCGQTPGKMALRIKVIRTDGSPVTYARAALREVLGKFVSGILLGIGYLMVAFDSQKQGLHDKIADTYVIKL